MLKTHPNILSKCHRILGTKTWERILTVLGCDTDPEDALQKRDSLKTRPGFSVETIDLITAASVGGAAVAAAGEKPYYFMQPGASLPGKKG